MTTRSVILRLAASSFFTAGTYSQLRIARTPSHSDPDILPDPSDNRQQKRTLLAIVYVKKYFRNRISAEMLSLEVNLSVARLQSGMKIETGMTVAEFIELTRVEVGKTLLADTNHAIRNIAKEVGFKTQSHFGDVFKKLTGLSPLQYRNCYGC